MENVERHKGRGWAKHTKSCRLNNRAVYKFYVTFDGNAVSFVWPPPKRHLTSRPSRHSNISRDREHANRKNRYATRVANVRDKLESLWPQCTLMVFVTIEKLKYYFNFFNACNNLQIFETSANCSTTNSLRAETTDVLYRKVHRVCFDISLKTGRFGADFFVA